MPRSRKLLAVPFVGKDVPSEASEFSHPDVVIGLSILAYRYEGLRKSDYRSVMVSLQSEMQSETGPYKKREAWHTFAKWVALSGARVRGVTPEQQRGFLRGYESEQDAANVAFMTESFGINAAALLQNVPALQLIDVRDTEQTTFMMALLDKNSHIIQHYLYNIIFPETMEFQESRLSANGQELGGDLIFGTRLGFSGTPSDLLPVALQPCNYEQGDDANMLHILTSPEVAHTHYVADEWSVTTILNIVARSDPPYNALIDTGALVTGMSNYEVALYLLENGLPTMEGVVYLDEDDAKMILLRSGAVMKLSQCGIPLDKKFSFYDQVHTTGMDINQTISARAALTLGKDMTFRDYAQGSFRMRGIGKGQTISLIIVPEIRQLICCNLALSHGLDENAWRQQLEELDSASQHTQTLRDVCAWLVINSMESEKLQFKLLCEQSITNVWRKASYKNLKANHHGVGTPQCDPFTLSCLNTYRERVDFAIENSTVKSNTFTENLDAIIRDAVSRGFLVKTAEMDAVHHIQTLATSAEEAVMSPTAASPSSDATEQKFDGEQVQEQETEQETEQEIEQEKEEVLEIEQEVEEYVKQKYARNDEVQKPWSLCSLALEPSMKAQGFFSCSEFAVLKKATVKPKPIGFPTYLQISRNHYDPSWSLTTKRRLKNMICVMEYVPDEAALKYGVHDGTDMTPQQLQRLKKIFKLFDGNNDGKIDRSELADLMTAIGVEMDEDGITFLDSIIASAGPSELIPFDVVDDMMQHQQFFNVQSGRYSVALSLIEAASLRAVLHSREDTPLDPQNPRMSAALHIVAPTAFGQTLASSHGYTTPSKYQRNIANNCYRFIDSETAFSEEQLNLLLMAVQNNSCAVRVAWFVDVLQCRRRAQKPWSRTQLARLFTTADQYQFLESRALRFRVRSLVKQKGLFIRDAFRLFNLSDTGMLTCTEFYSGLCWLGLSIDITQLHDIVRSVDSDDDGLVHFSDFKKAFHAEGDEQSVLDGTEAVKDVNAIVIPQTPVKELADELNEPQEMILIPDAVVRGFKAKVREPADFTRLWSSEDTLSREPASVWAPSTQGGLFSGDKFLACVGHYASPDHHKYPTEVKLVRLRNARGGRFSPSADHKADMVRRYMPHPRRFQQVWNKQLGEDSIYVWKPIPHAKRFVALGMVVTTTDEPPEREIMHCVPRRWVMPTAFEPQMVWDDSGTGGRPGSLWVVNELGLMAATTGHFRPQGTFYTLKSEGFYIGPNDDLGASPSGKIITGEVGVSVADPGFSTSNQFTHIWDDKGSGASMDGSVWRPLLEGGFVFFGDYMHGSHEPPEVDVLVCKEPNPEDLSSQIKKTAFAGLSKNKAPFERPEGWQKMWSKKRGKLHLYAWNPIAPSTDYVALGHVVTVSAETPSLESYRLIHRSLLVPKSLGDLIWTDKGSWGGKDGSVWAMPAPCKTFLVHGGSHERPEWMAHALRGGFLPTAKRTIGIAMQDHEAEDPATQLSFKKGAHLTITYDDATNPWWEGYVNDRPTKVGLVPSNYITIVPTTLCLAVHDWPQPGQPGSNSDLSFTAGDKILALRTSHDWWEGFLEREPARVAKFPSNFVKVQ
jgi:Ca2+-binding EF-hand superfamily protein